MTVFGKKVLKDICECTEVVGMVALLAVVGNTYRVGRNIEKKVMDFLLTNSIWQVVKQSWWNRLGEVNLVIDDFDEILWSCKPINSLYMWNENMVWVLIWWWWETDIKVDSSLSLSLSFSWNLQSSLFTNSQLLNIFSSPLPIHHALNNA